PKTIDFTIDYLRAGHYRDTYAECRVTRLGRRVANVHISAWQVRREDPIAIARAHFLLAEETA
ncbi:MAG: PaaI family thioesterase, partial [Alcanivoracaceae bacterium]